MKRMVSGIKPTGEVSLGNYIGAIKNFVNLQEEFDLFVFVADLHALTTKQDKQELRRRIKAIAGLYIACGLDPEKTTIFIQSEVAAHSMMSYILECNTYMGELKRMTQFKDKSQKKQDESIRSSLFTYPVLMAADILIYDAEYVPVGDDQKQHVELTRDIAKRFNNSYNKEFFVVPEPVIPKKGARIMDLQEPSKKMSKTEDNDKGVIMLLDDINIIKKKIKSAVTDSIGTINYDKENQPGLANLLTIYSSITGEEINDIVNKYQGQGYKEFKEDLSEIVASLIEPIQKRYFEIINSKYLDEVLDQAAEKANKIAYKKISKIYETIGLGRKRK